MASNYELIKDAIINKKIVIATYHGQVRKMCPHVIGTKNGEASALFYQFAGGSNSGLSSSPAKNWRCLKLRELSNVRIEDGEWRTASNHTRPQACVGHIDVEVAY